MSIFDIVYSSAHFVGTWAFPKVTNVWGARGSDGTCVAQGFVVHFGYGVLFYNLVLAVYFGLVIKHRAWQPRLSRVEPYIHAAVVLYSLGAAMVNVFFDTIGPSGTICMLRESSNLEHEGGGTQSRVLWLCVATVAIPFLVTVTVGSVSMVSLYLHVRLTEQRLDKYAAQIRTNKALGLMRVQCSLYIAGLLLVWGPGLIDIFIHWTGNGSTNFWWSLFSTSFTPLQGVFNVAIYWQSLNQSTDQRLQRHNYKSEFSIGTINSAPLQIINKGLTDVGSPTRSESCPRFHMPADSDWDVEGAIEAYQSRSITAELSAPLGEDEIFDDNGSDDIIDFEEQYKHQFSPLELPDHMDGTEAPGDDAGNDISDREEPSFLSNSDEEQPTL